MKQNTGPIIQDFIDGYVDPTRRAGIGMFIPKNKFPFAQKHPEYTAEVLAIHRTFHISKQTNNKISVISRYSQIHKTLKKITGTRIKRKEN